MGRQDPEAPLLSGGEPRAGHVGQGSELCRLSVRNMLTTSPVRVLLVSASPLLYTTDIQPCNKRSAGCQTVAGCRNAPLHRRPHFPRTTLQYGAAAVRRFGLQLFTEVVLLTDLNYTMATCVPSVFVYLTVNVKPFI